MSAATKQLLDLIRNGDETSVRGFVTDHWSEFPQDIQDHLSAALFADALKENTEQNEEFEDFKESLLSFLESEEQSQ